MLQRRSALRHNNRALSSSQTHTAELETLASSRDRRELDDNAAKFFDSIPREHRQLFADGSGEVHAGSIDHKVSVMKVVTYYVRDIVMDIHADSSPEIQCSALRYYGWRYRGEGLVPSWCAFRFRTRGEHCTLFRQCSSVTLKHPSHARTHMNIHTRIHTARARMHAARTQ